jgi:hypothetical protein
MGGVPIWKILDLTQKIWLEKERKGRKIMGREAGEGKRCKGMGLRTIPRRCRVCETLLVKRSEILSCYGLRRAWKMFYNQGDKRSYSD